MVVVRGKRSRGTSGVPGIRTALALVLTVVASQACGSRSMLNTDEESGAAGDDTGGSTSSGTGGRGGAGTGGGGSYGIGGDATAVGGTYGSKGGSTGKGGTGYGGTYGGTYGKGAGPGKGGTYGKGGSAGYPMMVGGAYPYAGYGGTYPGYGGAYPTAGRASYGGRVGRGGSGGTGYSGRPSYGGKGGSAGGPDEGGAAGEAGGGIGGFGGSPAVVAACQDACNNLPASCPSSQSYTDCMIGCVPYSTTYPECELELADYLTCLAANLSPDAECMVDSGGCYGNGCLDTAQNNCVYWGDTFFTCADSGCGTAVGSGPGFCSYESQCPNHDHQTVCNIYDYASDLWYCSCVIDSTLAFETYVEGYSTQSCQAVSDACNLAR